MRDGRLHGVWQRLLLVVQLAVSAGALVLLFRGLDLGTTLDAFKDANYWLLPVAVALLLVDLGLRSVRWRLLLRPQSGLSLDNLFGATNVGYLVNNILPFRAGEIARVLAVDRLEKTGRLRAASSVAIERGIDLVAMVVLVVALFPFIEEPDWARGPALLLGAVVVAGFVTLGVIARLNESGHGFWRPLVRAVPRFSARLEHLMDQVLAGFHPLLRWRVLAEVLVLTAIIWACAALSFYTVMSAFNLDLRFSAAALVLGATTLGMVVPSSPGYIGVFHAIAVETLVSVFGVPREHALTYAVAQHAVIVIVPSMLGIAFLLRRRSMWHDIVASLRGRGPDWTAKSASPPTLHGDAAAMPGGGVDP